MFVRIGGKRKQSPRLPALVTLFAITLAALLWPGVSSADDCSGLAACQATDQARLLGPFNALLGSPAGAAVLATNLQTQNAIYLNSTQAQKVASGTVLIVQYIAANILLRAFPDNPNFGYTQGGLPNAPSTPGSIAAAVSDIYGKHPTERHEAVFRLDQRLSVRLRPVARTDRLGRQPTAVPGLGSDPRQSIHRRELIASCRPKSADTGRVRHQLAGPG
jgi:hypothetical protein